jgi:hypothetical protein
MAAAERLDQIPYLLIQALVKKRRLHDVTANLTADQSMGDDFIPAVIQHVLELDGILWTDPPACGAPGATRHIVKQCLRTFRFTGIQRPGGTILHTCKASVAFLIYLKIDHSFNR